MAFFLVGVSSFPAARASALFQAFLLLLLALWTIIVHEAKQIGSSLLVKSGVELVQCWGNLQPCLQNSLLSLKTDILGPFNKPAQISLGLDVLTDFETSRSSNKERIFHSLNFGFLYSQRSGCDLLSLLLSFLLNHDDRL